MEVYTKIKSILSLLFILTGSATIAQDIVVHDPVVIKQKDTYYLYCTGNGISVFSSKDLKKWNKKQQVLQR